MSWLKGLGISLKVAVLALFAVLAVMAAKRQKAIADKWADSSIDLALGNVAKGTTTAAAASAQAKLHSNNARKIKLKAEARLTQIGETDEDVKDLVARWGT